MNSERKKRSAAQDDPLMLSGLEFSFVQNANALTALSPPADESSENSSRAKARDEMLELANRTHCGKTSAAPKK